MYEPLAPFHHFWASDPLVTFLPQPHSYNGAGMSIRHCAGFHLRIIIIIRQRVRMLTLTDIHRIIHNRSSYLLLAMTSTPGIKSVCFPANFRKVGCVSAYCRGSSCHSSGVVGNFCQQRCSDRMAYSANFWTMLSGAMSSHSPGTSAFSTLGHKAHNHIQ